jgi:hypothetical protein
MTISVTAPLPRVGGGARKAREDADGEDVTLQQLLAPPSGRFPGLLAGGARKAREDADSDEGSGTCQGYQV